MDGKVLKFSGEREAIDDLDQDLSEFDVSQFKPVTFECAVTSRRFDLGVPRRLLAAVKRRANAKGVPVNRCVRELMERDLLHGSAED